jgi:hypothetical protein
MWDSTWIRLGAESSDMCRDGSRGGSALGQLTSKGLGKKSKALFEHVEEEPS